MITNSIKKRSTIITNLRAVAIILVVIYHAMDYAGNYLNGASASWSLCLSVMDAVHVPLFLMISGYLCHPQNVLKYYKKKTFQIIVPFLVFSFIKLVVNLNFDQFSHAGTAGGEILKAYLFGEYYWFSYCLFFLCLLAPLLWKLKSRLAIIGVFALVLSFNVLNGFFSLVPLGGPFQIFTVLIFGTWFLLGYMLRQLKAGELLNKKAIKHIVFLLSVVVSALAINLYSKNLLEGFLRKFLMSVSSSYILVYLFSFLRFEIFPLNYISKYSYQTFFLDSFVKVVLFAVASRFLTIDPTVVLLIGIVNVLVSTFICFIAHKIKFIKTLFGLS